MNTKQRNNTNSEHNNNQSKETLIAVSSSKDSYHNKAPYSIRSILLLALSFAFILAIIVLISYGIYQLIQYISSIKAITKDFKHQITQLYYLQESDSDIISELYTITQSKEFLLQSLTDNNKELMAQYTQIKAKQEQNEKRLQDKLQQSQIDLSVYYKDKLSLLSISNGFKDKVIEAFKSNDREMIFESMKASLNYDISNAMEEKDKLQSEMIERERQWKMGVNINEEIAKLEMQIANEKTKNSITLNQLRSKMDSLNRDVNALNYNRGKLLKDNSILKDIILDIQRGVTSSAAKCDQNTMNRIDYEFRRIHNALVRKDR